MTPQKGIIYRSPIKLNKTSFKEKMLFPISNNNLFNKSKSPSRTRTVNYNNISQNFITKPYNANFKFVTQDIPETSCYFKLSDNSTFKFNPLNNSKVNPINFNYFEGTILIDKIFDKLKLIQKSDLKYIGIDLKDIVDIQLSEEMEKILKIYKLYLRDGKDQQNCDVNKFISTNNEIINIHMHQNDKIKAINCSFFIFSIILGKRFVPKAEFIFDNYENFDLWFNCIESIVKINNPNKDNQ